MNPPRKTYTAPGALLSDEVALTIPIIRIVNFPSILRRGYSVKADKQFDEIIVLPTDGLADMELKGIQE